MGLMVWRQLRWVGAFHAVEHVIYMQLDARGARSIRRAVVDLDLEGIDSKGNPRDERDGERKYSDRVTAHPGSIVTRRLRGRPISRLLVRQKSSS